VVRFVPEPARGEFANVGVIVVSDATGTLCCRASAVNHRAPAVQKYLATVHRAVAASPSDVSEAWLWREHQALSNLVDPFLDFDLLGSLGYTGTIRSRR